MFNFVVIFDNEEIIVLVIVNVYFDVDIDIILLNEVFIFNEIDFVFIIVRVCLE